MKYEIPSVDDTPIWDIWLSLYKLPTLTAALDSGLFESLAESPATPNQLSERCGLDQLGTSIVLQMLAAMGLLEQRRGEYHLSDISSLYLLKDSPYSWGGVLDIVCESNEQHITLVEKLSGKSTEAGLPAEEEETPAEAWESGQLDMEMARRIARFMHSHSVSAAAGLAKSGLFDGVRRLLDIGGGSGCFSIALAQNYPDMHCTVMELPAMCEIGAGYASEGNVGEQVDFVSVDMFRDDWPTGYDALLFSNIFHDWDMDMNAGLAANAYEALPPGGRICLHEMLLNDSGIGPETANAFSILMLSRTKGRQFTFSELKELLERAGFTGIDVNASYGYYSVVRGYKK